MPRSHLEMKTGLCCLILIGTAAGADGEMVFDLSQPPIRQVAAQPRFAGSGGEPQYAPSPESSPPPLQTSEPGPSMFFPDSPESASPSPAPGSHQVAPVPGAPEDDFFGWRPPPRHYELPSRSFSLFRSPASYGWAYHERCAPTPWTPRGEGIPRRTSCYRMDYAPYQLEHDHSDHGPAFYRNYDLYPCEECHAHRHHLQRFYGRRR